MIIFQISYHLYNLFSKQRSSYNLEFSFKLNQIKFKLILKNKSIQFTFDIN